MFLFRVLVLSTLLVISNLSYAGDQWKEIEDKAALGNSEAQMQLLSIYTIIGDSSKFDIYFKKLFNDKKTKDDALYLLVKHLTTINLGNETNTKYLEDSISFLSKEDLNDPDKTTKLALACLECYNESESDNFKLFKELPKEYGFYAERYARCLIYSDDKNKVNQGVEILKFQSKYSPYAKAVLGMFDIENGNKAAGVKLLEEAVDQGFVEVAQNLTMIYLADKDLKNKKKAKIYAAKAFPDNKDKNAKIKDISFSNGLLKIVYDNGTITTISNIQ